MQKESITLRQATCTIILFVFGSSVVMGVSGTAAQDAWLSVLLAAAMVLPLLLVYARIIRLFPETDFYDVLEILYGKIFGRVFIALITWFALHLCALVLRNFSEFLQIVSMPETPQIPLMVAMILVTAYLAKSGTSAVGKWSVIMFPIVSITVIVTVILSISVMDFSNLEPVMEKGIGPVVEGAIEIFAFPFAETLLFMCLAGAMKRQDSPYKLYSSALLISVAFLLFIMVRNITVLGATMISSSYFPSYTMARILSVGDFLSRIEVTITTNFLLAGIVKITVCLLAAAKGIAKLFAIQNHKAMIMPVSMLALALCAIVYKSAMEMFGFLKYYQIYAIPFQIIIPITAWITAEIRAKKRAAA